GMRVHSYQCAFDSWFVCLFFFSSRRRHTRCYRDWSSDVCSSDLTLISATVNDIEHIESQSLDGVAVIKVFFQPTADVATGIAERSEERRVGKESGCGWERRHEKKEGERRRDERVEVRHVIVR